MKERKRKMLNEEVLSNNFLKWIKQTGSLFNLKSGILPNNSSWPLTTTEQTQSNMPTCVVGALFGLWVHTYIWHWLLPWELPKALFSVDGRQQVLFLLTPGPLVSSRCKQEPVEPGMLINLSPSQWRVYSLLWQ